MKCENETETKLVPGLTDQKLKLNFLKVGRLQRMSMTVFSDNTALGYLGEPVIEILFAMEID